MPSFETRSALPTQLARFLAVAVCLLLAACSTNVSRFQMPGTDLSAIRTLYVSPPDNKIEADELRSLIKSNLEARGYRVADRDEAKALGEGDYFFDYSTDWAWDITWYLLELRVAVYDPADGTLIAQAQSLQTSLVRGSLRTVVARAIAELFDDSETLDDE